MNKQLYRVIYEEVVTLKKLLIEAESFGADGKVAAKLNMSLPATVRLPSLRFPNGIGETKLLSQQAHADDITSDEALMSLICQGDQEVLASLFRRYARVVRGVALRILKDPSEAEDLLQDVFILIHRLCRTFDSSKGSARFWILQMTYRRAISRRRYLTTRHFYTKLELEDVESELADPRTSAAEIEELIDATRGNGSLQRVFEELSENQQQTLKLFFVEGYTFDEIAERLGQSRGNIKNHYFRGLDRLRKHVFSGKLAGPGAV